MSRGQFTADQIDKTMDRLETKLADSPEALQHLEDLRDAADERRYALNVQTSVGERFGETAGEFVAQRDGLVGVVADGNPGVGAVDQAYKTPDSSQLVIQEVKGPSADLGIRKVPDGNGGVMPALQGSEAYLRAILRVDTRLRDAILADPALVDRLLNGEAIIRYRLIQPNATGHIRVTEFTLNQATLGISEWILGS